VERGWIALRSRGRVRTESSLVSDLIASGYVDRQKVGRRNHYRLHSDVKMRHAAQADHGISELIDTFQLPDVG
jgi:hypothetical protein